MKTMKAFCTAIVLSLTISISAFAGEIATPGAAQIGNTGTGTLATAPSGQSATTTEVGDLSASMFGDVLLTLISMF